MCHQTVLKIIKVLCFSVLLTLGCSTLFLVLNWGHAGYRPFHNKTLGGPFFFPQFHDWLLSLVILVGLLGLNLPFLRLYKSQFLTSWILDLQNKHCFEPWPFLCRFHYLFLDLSILGFDAVWMSKMFWFHIFDVSFSWGPTKHKTHAPGKIFFNRFV